MDLVDCSLHVNKLKSLKLHTSKAEIQQVFHKQISNILLSQKDFWDECYVWDEWMNEEKKRESYYKILFSKKKNSESQ